MSNLNEIINQPQTKEPVQDTRSQIADMLTEYNIGYLQNQPLLFGNSNNYQVRKPAFWLAQDSNIIVDISQDSSSAEKLSSLYKSNGFDTIVITPKYTANPIWQDNLYQRINSYRHNQPNAYDMLPAGYR